MKKRHSAINKSSRKWEDTPNEKIIVDIQKGLREVLNGEGIPAEEAIALMRKQLAEEKNDNRVGTKEQ